jgi:hypothetical protein
MTCAGLTIAPTLFNGRPGSFDRSIVKELFGYLTASILLKLLNHFCLYCADFFYTEATLNSPTISSYLLWSNKLYSAVCIVNFVTVVFSLLISLCFNNQISHPYKSDWMPCTHIVYAQNSISNYCSEFLMFITIYLHNISIFTKLLVAFT